MSEIKITDLVPQETIDSLKSLAEEMQNLVADYTATARELAKGLKVDVKMTGDIDKLEKLFIQKSNEAAAQTERLNAVVAKQGQVIANTTNTLSRQLMEQERVNKTQRESYTEHEKVKTLIEHFHDTYQDQLSMLVKVDAELKENKKAQGENEKMLAKGTITYEQFTRNQEELVKRHRELTQEKRTLTQIMTAEEKAAQSADTSYDKMSQQLELLKKAYKGLSEENRNSDYGKELEAAIQNLDAHLKDTAADMGEFQRNVGNYAIAGQNGVVATESLMAAMQQEARTTQDLIDQTKILEEARTMLNKDDANYMTTLDSLNAKIEENKRKLSDVSDIISKDATSVAEAEAQNKRLQEALKRVDLTSDDAQKRIKELNDKIAANTKLIRENTPALQDETKAIEQQKKANEGLTDSLFGLIGVNANFGSSLQSLNTSGSFLDGLRTKIQAFGQTLLGLLANPWVLTFLGIASVVASFKWWYDFNKGLIEASRLTQNFTGLVGDAADKVQSDLQVLSDHMGQSFDKTIGAANTLVQQFGISWEEALQKIQDGIEAGADMNGNLLDNINQFGPALRDAGVSVDEFVSILAETRNGIFDEKGINDIIKGGTRLRAMTKQIAESLDACGISSQQMQKDLTEGNITMLDAVQQVAAKLKELPENSQEAGLVMKNVFGRTAAEGGTLLIQSIADVNTNLDKAKESMGELGRVNHEQMEAQKQLNEILTSVFKMSGTSFEEMITQAKTFVTQGLVSIIKGCVEVVNWFVRIYNKSIVVRGGVQAVSNAFKLLWEVAKFVLSYLVDSFKSMATVIEGVVTLDWGKVTDGWKSGMNALKGNVVEMAKNIASSTADAFNKTLKDEMDEVSIGFNADIEGIGAREATEKQAYISKDNKVDEKAAAKAVKETAKEELKRINELEETKIAIMEESHEKELAMIRLKYKKKIDEITGEGETESTLRLQLAEQCQQEIAKCELKYQKEMAKINLDNRLVSVREGSKEELDLRLAKTEAARAAEIEAAKKTGADVNFINAKFDRQRLELEEDHAAKVADIVQRRYAAEQSAADNAYISALNALKARYAEELEAAKGNNEEQARIKAKFEEDQTRLSEDYAKSTAQHSIDMLEEVLQNEKLSAEERARLEQELADAKVDLETAIADATIAEIDRVNAADNAAREKRIANAQMWMQKAGEAMNAINGLVGAVYDGRISKIEDEQDALQTASDEEQQRVTELVEKKVISEEEGEARKRAAEAKTAQKNEEFERKKAALQEKQAKWDKANSIAQAAIATALAITQALPNLILAAIAGAMGAAQIATIVATPIPKYAKGTDYHKGGPAIVGDGGRPEVVVIGNTAWLTPDRPTLVDIPQGASVLPGIMEMDMLIPQTVDAPSVTAAPVVVNNDYRRLEEKMDSFIYLLRKQTALQHRDSVDRAYETFKKSKV